MMLDEFFRTQKERALTFDDVELEQDAAQLVPCYSEIMPDEASTDTKLTPTISLKIPFLSSAMDTVTEHELAIALARAGGLGIVHSNCSVEEQKWQVTRVKYKQHGGAIGRPICVNPDWTMAMVLRMREREGYEFDSFLVRDNDGGLAGVVTEHDFDLCEHLETTPVRERMTSDVLTGSVGIAPADAVALMRQRKIKFLPLVDADGRIGGLMLYNDLCRDIKNMAVDERGQLIVGAAIGAGEADRERLDELVRRRLDVAVIDAAHGHSKAVIEQVMYCKHRYPNLQVIAGNVCTAEGTEALCRAGADAVKVGIGPSGICTTRVVTGFGIPQVTAVYECAVRARQFGVPVCADGGIRKPGALAHEGDLFRYSGDVAVALAVGASTVMMGSVFAGTAEAPGDIIFDKGRQYKRYRGMGSYRALQERGALRYNQAGVSPVKRIAEGVDARVPFKGPVAGVIEQFTGGLRLGMGYAGARTILELQEKARLRRITAAGIVEAHPHDVEIVEEAPNYSRP